MNKLTIAIPTFGKAHFLAECLQSVAEQTCPVDCIVCDGGSNFNFSDPKWHWVKHRRLIPDPGMVTCWSEAANGSQTDYIAFLADDNTLEPNFAELMLNFMEAHPTCEVVFCNQYVIDTIGKVDIEASHEMTNRYGRDHLIYGLLYPSDTAHLVKNNSIPLEACIIKRSIWNKYGPLAKQAFGAFDLYFFTKLLVQGVQFGFLPSYLTRFRVHADSYTARLSEEHLRGVIWAMQNIHSDNKALSRLINNRAITYFGHLLKRDIPSEERKLIQKQLCTSMFGLKILAKANLSYYFRR